MNEYIKSIETLNNWWNALDERWRRFLYIEYFYNCDISTFYEVCESVLNQQFMDAWLDENLIPSIIHYSLQTTKLNRFDLEYINNDETALFSFNDINIMRPIKDMVNLVGLYIPGTIKDFNIQYLRDLVNLEVLTIAENFIKFIPEILLINLPKLKLLSIEIDVHHCKKEDLELIEKMSLKTRIEIKTWSYEEAPKFVISTC